MTNPFEEMLSRLESIESRLAEVSDLVRHQSQPQAPTEIGGIDLAVEITGLAKQTIYGHVSRREIPFAKRGKRLYFQRTELLKWISDARKPTADEIKAEAEAFTRSRNKAPKA